VRIANYNFIILNPQIVRSEDGDPVAAGEMEVGPLLWAPDERPPWRIGNYTRETPNIVDKKDRIIRSISGITFPLNALRGG
jgi:hypothetical protein